MKKRILFCLVLLDFLILNLNTSWLMHLDQAVYQFLMIFESERMTTLMTMITNMGSGMYFFILCVVCLLIKVKDVWHISANVSLSAILNTGLKNIVKRSRPMVDKLTEASGYSFPSGHTSAAMSFYGYLYLMIEDLSLTHSQKKIARIILILLIFMIGISRIYLGAHYFSDVLAGWAAGYLYLQFYLWLKKNYFKKSK